MAPRLATFGLAVVMLAAGCLSEKTPGYCSTDLECPSGTRCKLDSPKKNSCVPRTDGAPDDSGRFDGSDAQPDTDSRTDTTSACTTGSCGPAAPICDSASKTCRACSGGTECATLNASTPACVGGKCVACGANSDCKTATSPICDTTANACRACGTTGECMTLNSAAPVCLPAGSCVECGGSTDCTAAAAKPICDTAKNTCKACSTGTECAAKSAATPACAASGKCVECVSSSDCKTSAKPVCEPTTNTCRTCSADAECPADPGLCMTDGHCATSGEVIFVEFKGAGCPGADGSSAKPYCTPNDGVAQLSAGRHVIVIRGAASGQLALATSGISPVIVGRKNSSGVDASVPATVSASVGISSDTVLIRDLTVNAGTTPTSSGVLVTGSSTKAMLLRVTAALGTGLGIDAEAGSSLTMDRCLVQNNSAGGILVDGASYNIQNSIVAANGYGVTFTASTITSGSTFAFNTVVATGSAVTCDPSDRQTVTNSIVSGLNVSCTLTNSITAAPTFSGTNPYHLTGHLPCPSVPASFPNHDFDGDPRAVPIDCGADQYVP